MKNIFYTLRKGFCIITFKIWQFLGFHLSPNHFYEPIPDTRTLDNNLWNKPSSLPGLNLNIETQLAFLINITKHFKHEYSQLPLNKTHSPYTFYINNKAFEGVDAEVLYSFIRTYKPSKIFEIGSGFSTLLSAKALLKNKEESGKEGELISFEPFPNKYLQNGFPGLTRLEKKKIEEIPLKIFEQLGENDILFIDSSHVLRIGNDVYYEYLEILPRLNKGVLVHIHDIFLPYEYPKKWVKSLHRFWTEQYLLQAFLAFNSKYEILWAGSYIHSYYPERLRDAFPSYQSQERLPGSFWIRKIN